MGKSSSKNVDIGGMELFTLYTIIFTLISTFSEIGMTSNKEHLLQN